MSSRIEIARNNFEWYFKEDHGRHQKIIIVGEWQIPPFIFYDLLRQYKIPDSNVRTFRSYTKIHQHLNIDNYTHDGVLGVLVGPVPHSNPSAIRFGEMSEQINILRPGFPPFIKLRTESHVLKITKHSLGQGIKLLHEYLFNVVEVPFVIKQPA